MLIGPIFTGKPSMDSKNRVAMATNSRKATSHAQQILAGPRMFAHFPKMVMKNDENNWFIADLN